MASGVAVAHGRPMAREFPEKISGKRLTDAGSDAPVRQRLRRMFARRAGTEVVVHEQDCGAAESGRRKRMAGTRPPVVLEDVITEALERDGLQVAGRDDPIGIDVVTAQRNGGPFDLVDPPRHTKFLRAPHRGLHAPADGVARSGASRAHDLRASPASLARGLASNMSRTSVTSPATAAAATMAGLISKVRPVGLP